MIKILIKYACTLKTINILISLLCCQELTAQKNLNVGSLKDFKNAGTNWHITGDVTAHLNKKVAFFTLPEKSY